MVIDAAGDRLAVHSLLLPARADAAYEEVVHAPEMAPVVVVGEPLPEVAVQGDAVEQVLQMVAMLGHRRRQRLLLVVGRGVTEMVRFPVEDVVAVGMAEDQVDEALEIAGQRLEAQPRQRVAVPVQPVIEHLGRDSCCRQVEPQFDQALLARDGGEDDIARQSGRQDVVEQAAQHARQTRGGFRRRQAGQRLWAGGQRLRDGVWPATRIGKVDTLEEGVHAIAGGRTAREAENVVGRDLRQEQRGAGAAAARDR